jgi:precorrin-3B synthase
MQFEGNPMAGERERRGYCPRVWTPMQSGDGLLVRVHSATRWLSADALRVLAALSERHGNGLIDVTRRANLQLRGVTEASLGALQTDLVESGWAERSAAHERRFVLQTTPFLGLDPACAALGGLLATLEGVLTRSAENLALHPKLAIVLDGPERTLRALHADLRLTLDASATWVELAAGCSARAMLSLGRCPIGQAAAWVESWITKLATPPEGLRVQQWVAQHGRAALESDSAGWLGPAAMQQEGAPAAPPTPGLLGFGQREQASWFGLMPPFGGSDATQWRALAQLAERFGDGRVRVHPGRGLLLAQVAEAHAGTLAHEAERAGFCVRADDPLARVVACAGAPACASAQGETRGLARELAALAANQLKRGALLHVSGCEKSCSHSGPADLVLVHTKSGPRLGFGCDAASAAQQPASSLEGVRAALSASAREYATPAPDQGLSAHAPGAKQRSKPSPS